MGKAFIAAFPGHLLRLLRRRTMRTTTLVYPVETLSQQSVDLEPDEPPPNSADQILTPNVPTPVPPGMRVKTETFRAKTVITVFGIIVFRGRLLKPPKVVLFRSDEKVLVIPAQIPPAGGGEFQIQIDKANYPSLFPGDFKVAIRNPKDNTPTIVVDAVVLFDPDN